MKIIITSPLAEPLAKVVVAREIHGEEMGIQCVKITFSSALAIVYFILSHPEDLVHVEMTNEQFVRIQFIHILLADILFYRDIYDEKGNLIEVQEVFFEKVSPYTFGTEVGHPLCCLRQVWRAPESLVADEYHGPESRFN